MDDAIIQCRQAAAVDQGWVLIRNIDVHLAPLYDEPEYHTMMAEIETKLAAQLERVCQMEADGEPAPMPH